MRRLVSVVKRPIVLAIVLFAMLAGCAQSDRGERIFTRQNRAAAALATVILEVEKKTPHRTEPLYDSESRLDEACAGLREAALRMMNGEPVGPRSKMRALASLDECAAETKRIERLVRRANPEVARFYLGPPATALRRLN